jgi:hypothetical protein
VFRYRTGIAWRDLPGRFGPWQTVWKRHHRFATDGTRDKRLRVIQAEADAAVGWIGTCRSTPRSCGRTSIRLWPSAVPGNFSTTVKIQSCISAGDLILWAREDSNLRPTDYESAALTRLSYGPGPSPFNRTSTSAALRTPKAPRIRALGSPANLPSASAFSGPGVQTFLSHMS